MGAQPQLVQLKGTLFITHFFNLNFKIFRLFDSRTSSGRLFHCLVALYLNEFLASPAPGFESCPNLIRSLLESFYFLIAQPLGWAITTYGQSVSVWVSVCVNDNLKPCDWSTLGLSSVNQHPPEHHWHNPRNMSSYNPRNLSCVNPLYQFH